MSEKTTRIEWIDVLKFFCMFFVMVSHLGGGFIAMELNRFYITFYLTGFFFASGYTYKHRDGFRSFLSRKIRQLLIPWALFSLLNISLSQVLSFHPEWHPGFWSEIGSNLMQIRERGDGSMWFISALFTAYIPFYFLIKQYQKQKENIKNIHIWYLLLSVLCIVVYEGYSLFVPWNILPWETNTLPWHLEYIIFVDAFMFFGYITKERYEKMIDELDIRSVLLAFVTVVGLPMMLKADMSNPFFRFPYNVLSQLIGTLFIVILSKKIVPLKAMLFCGRNTLAYYGMHGKLLALCEAIIRKVSLSIYETICASSLLSTIYSLIMGVFFVFALILPVRFVNRFLPFFVGKKMGQ